MPLAFVQPCYWAVERLGAGSTLLDFGLGFDADFSQAMMKTYGVRAVGFDPTRKHQSALRTIEASSGGRFTLIPAAIGGTSGSVEFLESIENVSGSLLSSHAGVQRDTIERYPVDMLSLADAFERAECAQPDLVKMDIEGAEYAALESASDDVLRAAKQWIIEFHHDLIAEAPFARTKALVKRFESLGFTSFTRDNVNFLLFMEP